MPDIPTQLPLTYCSQACRERVADAARRFLDHVTNNKIEALEVPEKTKRSMSLHIPDHLATYDADSWLPLVEPDSTYPLLVATEKYRQAQDAWANANGLDRTEFEALVKQQRAATSLTETT